MMLEAAVALRQRNALEDPLCFGIIVGNPSSMRDAAERILGLSAIVPEGAHWWVAKGSPYLLEAAALTISLGGHVRTGFEDTVFDFDGSQLAPSNAYLVESMAELIHRLGRQLATPDEARRILNIGNYFERRNKGHEG
jgi:3-keto-5-aminohexanoate cleavage enzyme